MEQRENFMTPMGSAHAADSLATPHFDEEATLLAARPVVPLEQVITTPATRQKKSLLLPIVIVAAALAGAAGAMAFDYFRNQRQASAAVPTSAQPAQSAPVAETSRAVAQPSAPPIVNVVAPSNKTPDASAIVPATESVNASKDANAPATERTERSINNTSSSDAKRAEREAALRATQAAEAKSREEAKAKNEKVSPPVITRERPRQVERAGSDEVETDWRDIREQRREGRREERRRERQADQGDDDSPRQQRGRGDRELNRIRDIFEGTRHP
jgi:hypothetical protein